MASWATFEAGEQLIGKGKSADHVIVILEGRTTICVNENGWERVLAECGPGQLVGELVGLHISIRSVRVIATERVHGLVVTTNDFRAFIGAHPRVLSIVADLNYDCLTEHRDHNRASTIGVVTADMMPAPVRPGEESPPRLEAPRPLNGENCTIVLTDVVAFGSPSRTDEDRRTIREALFGMTCAMLRDIADVRSEDRGDGILTVVPPSVPTADIIQRLHKELLPAIGLHNTTHCEPARFQLRAAVNVGPVTADAMGVSGEAIIIAARLLETADLKRAMRMTGAGLGVIVSEFVYQAIVRHGKDVTGYSQVQVKAKEFNGPAWMNLFQEPLPRSAPNPVAALHSISRGDLRHGWKLLGNGGQRVVTAVFCSAASSYLEAVRAAVPNAQRLVVTRPSRKTAAPQPARSSQAA
jgi:class 3 adenylate cyclase